MSPELLDESRKCRSTKDSDRYALAMVIYEILSGQAPFASDRDPTRRILRGERPRRPQGAQGELFIGSIWEMLERCWNSPPRDRPGLRIMLLCLEGTALPPIQNSSADEDIEMDVDNESDTTMGSNSSAYSLF